MTAQNILLVDEDLGLYRYQTVMLSIFICA
jgi:hypothetical protein